MKNILLPTDFSENAWNATKYAIEFFRGEPCVFHLLNTYTPAIVHSRFMAVATVGRELEDAVRVDSEKGLQLVLNRISKTYNYPNHSFRKVSSFNLLTEEIREAVERRHIDAIITGTTGATGLKEVFLGSNTVRIIKAVKECPVLAIPEDFEYVKPVEMALVTDFKRNFNAEIIEPLRHWAEHFGSSIRVMHINEKEQLDKYQLSNRRSLKKYLASIETTFHQMPYFASKSEVIHLFLEEFNIDMLAMINYRHSFLEELIKEPVIKRVAFHAQIPFLTIPE